MTHYPIRTVFYKSSSTDNSYGEQVITVTPRFTTGTRVATFSFRDRLQSEVSVDGTMLYLYARKNPNTKAVLVSDRVEMPGQSNGTFKVLAIDENLKYRDEIVFLVDLLETA